MGDRYKMPRLWRLTLIAIVAVAVQQLSPPTSASEREWRDRRPPTKSTTTLNIDGEPQEIRIFDRDYNGVRITHVGKSGLAALAGLTVGDVLLSLNAQPVGNATEADEVLNRLPTGNLEVAYGRMTESSYMLIETRLNFVNPYRSTPRLLRIDRTGTPGSLAEMETRMVALINRDREKARRNPAPRPVKADPGLTRLARAFAEDMAARGYFSHRTPEGRDAERRSREYGIAGAYAENLYAGGVAGGVEEAETSLMDEPDNVPGNHRDNILNPQMRYVGVGIARTAKNTLVIVQSFSDSPTDQ